MRKFILPLCLLATTIVAAQKIPEGKSYANSITNDDLQKHLLIVAGKEMEGRETATVNI